MSRNAPPSPTTPHSGDDSAADEPPGDVAVDPAALRAAVALLERDLAAREAQVSAIRTRYETALAARDEGPDREQVGEVRTDGGLLERIREVRTDGGLLGHVRQAFK